MSNLMNWMWFHKLGSPKWFYEISSRWLPWLALAAAVLLAVGLVWGLAFAPPDYQQGNSFRIIYIHVPAAFLAQSIYVMLAVAGVVGLVWKMKLADVALQQAAPIGAWMTAIALVTGAVLGIGGVVNIPIIKYSVEWWNTLHQPATFSVVAKPAMPFEMWMPLLIMVLGFYCFFGAVLLMRMRLEVLKREARSSWAKTEIKAQVEKGL